MTYIIKVNRSNNTFAVKRVTRKIVVNRVGRRGSPGVVNTIVAGENIAVDNTNPAYPVISASVESAVNSVNGETGDVIIDKTDIGLSNVDNTSDLNKPISTATQAALDSKVPGSAIKSIDLGNVGGNVNLNLALYSAFTATLTANTTFTFINWPAGDTVTEPIVTVEQGATGYTTTFAGVDWVPQNTPTTIPAAANQTAIYSFLSVDGGTNVIGFGQPFSQYGGSILGDTTTKNVAPDTDLIFNLGDVSHQYLNLYAQRIYTNPTYNAYVGYDSSNPFTAMTFQNTMTASGTSWLFQENGAYDALLKVKGASSGRAAYVHIESQTASYNAVRGNIAGTYKWAVGRMGDSAGVAIYTNDGVTKAALFDDSQNTTLYGSLNSRSIVPIANTTYNLGSSTNLYTNAYATKLLLGTQYIDGTSVAGGIYFRSSTASNINAFLFEDPTYDASLKLKASGTGRAAYIQLDSKTDSYNAVRGNVDGVLKWSVGRVGHNNGVSVYTNDGTVRAALFADDQNTSLFGTLFARAVQPTTTDVYDLGTSSLKYRYIYTNRLYLGTQFLDGQTVPGGFYFRSTTASNTNAFFFEDPAYDASLKLRASGSSKAAYIHLDSSSDSFQGIRGDVDGVLKWTVGRVGDNTGLSFYVSDGLTRAMKIADTKNITFDGNISVTGTSTFTGIPTAPTATAGTNNTQIATTAYVDGAVTTGTPDATTLIKGKIQLAGDLSGTAALPTVPGLATKEPTITAGTTAQYYRGDKTWQTLDKTAVGLANVDNTSDATKNSATATLDNKTLITPRIATIKDSSGNNAINLSVLSSATNITAPSGIGIVIAPGSGGGLAFGNGADSSKRMGLNLSGATTLTTTTLSFAQTVNRTITFPDATDTLVLLALAQTLTNKDLSSTTNIFPTFNQSTSGNAATATALQTARNINGVPFDGTGNITVADATKEPIITATTSGDYYRGDKSFQPLDKAAVGLSNVDNTSNATERAATATLTNKTINGPDNTITNIANASLANSSITIAGNAVALGGSVTQDNITGLSSNGLIKRTGANTLAPAVAGTDYLDPTAIGITIQAYDADLDTWAGKTAPSGTVVGTTDSQILSGKTLSGVTISDATDVVLSATTGTKIGTATTQKLGFFNATPVVQQSANIDLGLVLSNLGLRAASTTYPIATSGAVRFTGNFGLVASIRTSAVTLDLTSSPYQFADATTASFIITLPTIAASGYSFTFKKTDASANTVTVKAGASGTIDGSNTVVLTAQNQWVTVTSIATSGVWYITNRG
jgi:hypothetical protein